jgi:endonuclease/exonuclease/phosphatase (EEP) superfamily protein YafD
MILTGLSIFFFLLTVLGYRRWVWWFTLFDFFRLQYVAIALILLVASAFTGNLVMGVINILTIGLNLYRIRGCLPKYTPRQPVSKRDIMCVNAFNENDDLSQLAEILDKTNPEILLIMEVTQRLEDRLKDVINKYEYRLQTPVRDGFSICLLSKHKLEKPQVTFHGPKETPLLHAEVNLNGKEYHVFCAHPKPALSGRWYHHRREYFREITPIVRQARLPAIVLGDFNSVPWERHFVEFLEKAEIQSTTKDYGYVITWPVYCLPMGIPMDHILMDKNEDFSGLHVGPKVGSDHYPIAINI